MKTLKKIFNLDITNNNNTVGIYLINRSNGLEASGVPREEITFNINITNNKFKAGYHPLLMNNLGGNYSTFYIYNNEFENSGLHGITGFKVTGAIKQNRFTSSTENYCIYLSNSTPDMFGNSLKSDKRNIVLCNSYPRLAPIRNNNQLRWVGGKNTLRSQIIPILVITYV